MSGRKQHFIPQFVLRQFGEDAKGKKKQVRVFQRERTFISAPDGIGAAREFYSAINDDEATLDDIITGAEIEYAKIHRSLIDAPHEGSIDSEAASRLVCHLSVRGANLREAMSAGSEYAIRKAMDVFSNSQKLRQILGLSGSEPSGKLKIRLDQFYNENKAKIRKSGMSRHEFRIFAFRHVNRNWDSNFENSIPQMFASYSGIDFSALAAEAHKNILSEDLEPEKRVEAFSRLPWRVVETHQPLILPDCVIIVDDADEGVIPASFVGSARLRGALFPLTPNKALCGGTYANDAVLNGLLPRFSTIAAYNSWDFFVANPQTTLDEKLRDLIGGRITKTIISAVEEALRDALLDGLSS